MAETAGAVNARIVYWGVSEAGVSTSLRRIYSKLRPDHRGELREVPTRLDPTVCYEVLPIKLGQVGGVDTRIEIIAVPGAADHAPTRKQLLDRADGIVFVADARRERIGESILRFEELRQALSAYGRSLDSVPFVVQVNKRDLADPASLEELARKLDAPRASCFDTVAIEGTGLLQVLSTISKSVVRSLREPAPRPRPAPSQAKASPMPQPARPAAPKPTPPPQQAAPPAPAPPQRAPSARALSSPGDEWPAPIRARAVPEPVVSRVPSSPFDEVTGRLDLEPPAPAVVEAAPVPTIPPASVRVLSVGVARCEDDTTVLVPLELEDDAGRRFPLTLRVSVGVLAPRS